MARDFTHLSETGAARMVDVGDKPSTARCAVASARVRMSPDTLGRLKEGSLEKGEVLQVARLAGVMAAKRTGELIPLCHPLPLEFVGVEFEFHKHDTLRVTCEARTVGKTGVEMEALTAASVAALTVYDMCKAIDRGMVIESIQLEEKSGGQRGDWKRSSQDCTDEAPNA